MHNKKLLIIVIIFVVLGFVLVKTSKFIPIVLQVLFNREISLNKANGQTINILLLGKGGGTHEGPDLTDTIIFASINPDKKTVNLISLPRDLWVPELSGRINSAYAVGKEKQKDGGLILAKAMIGKVIGQPTDYGFVIDFDGFVKAVDLVGGLDINVDNTFDDYEYPVEEKREELCGHTLEEATALIASQSATTVFPCRYEHIHFEKGEIHLDGIQALKFVRSRHALGDEGTDFARSRRQQKVIAAFKDKIFSAGTLLNPIKINDLYSVLSDYIETDIPTSQIDDFIKLAQKMKPITIKTDVIDLGDESRPGLLLNPPLDQFNGSWVLIPKAGNGNYSEIQKFTDCIVASHACPSPTTAPTYK